MAPTPDTEVIGLHTPEMKKVAKDIAKTDSWRETVNEFANYIPLTGKDGLSHDERVIWGLVIDYVNCPLEERLALIDAYLLCIDNWA